MLKYRLMSKKHLIITQRKCFLVGSQIFSLAHWESLHNQVQFVSNPRLKHLSLSTKAHVLKCLWQKYSASQFTTLGRRRGSGGTEPPLAGSREYLNPQSSAPRRTRGQIQRERDVFPFILPHKAFIVPCGQRGRGPDTCTGAGGGTRKTTTYQILNLIHVR